MTRDHKGWLGQSLFFALEPERAHRVALAGLRALGSTALGRAGLRALVGAPEVAPVELWGLRFRNPLGLAAGWDKDALGLYGLTALGFGHVEVGTVTPRPQAGNPKPRIFRLPADRALINRMGFPGLGADFVARRLEGFRRSFARHRSLARAPDHPVIGVNIGKNKDTPNAQAAEEYAHLVSRFVGLADYLAINVSSPNTEGLRDLQGRGPLEILLVAALQARARSPHPETPILLKIAPDLGPEALRDVLDAALAVGVDGLVASNTTLGRAGLRHPEEAPAGGLSGSPLTGLADRFLSEVLTHLDGRLPVIASGGVMTGDDAARKLALGARLVQVYTGLVYGGPRWLRRTALALEG